MKNKTKNQDTLGIAEENPSGKASNKSITTNQNNQMTDKVENGKSGPESSGQNPGVNPQLHKKAPAVAPADADGKTSGDAKSTRRKATPAVDAAQAPMEGGGSAVHGNPSTPGGVSILSLRLSEEEISAEPSRLVRTEIIVGKPPKDQFFRVNPDPSYWGTFGLLTLDSDREVFLVTPEIRAALLAANENCLKVATLCVAVTRHGAPYLWPLKYSDTKWYDSSREIAKLATEQWLRLKSDQTAGYYVADLASDQTAVPSFPEEDFEQLLGRGFRNKIIADHDHEVLRQLRGEE